MEYHKFLFIIITFILISHSFSAKIEKIQNSKNVNFKQLHQFLEEPEVEPQNNDTLNEEEKVEEEEYINEEEDNKEEKEEEKEKDYNNDSSDKSKVNVKCLWVNKYNVYTLQKLQKKEKGDYEIKINDNDKVIFNFCQNTNTKSELESTVLWYKNKSYVEIAGSIDGKKSRNQWNEIHDESDDNGLFITLAEGDKCIKDINHQTYLRIVCDEDVEGDDFLQNIELSGFNDNTCKHMIQIKSIYGCALSELYLLKKVLNKYWYLFGTVLILIGGFLCFYGHKIIWITAIMVTGILSCFIVTILVLNFIPSLINTDIKLFILLGIGLLIGVVLGILVKKQVKLFACLLGASMGYSMAQFVYQIIQSFIEWNPQVLYYITIGICIVLGIFAGLFLYNSTLIIGTAILGGYIAMRGVSSIFGEYIDEGQFVDLIKNGEFEQLKEIRSGWTFAYLGLWLILILAGVYCQCKIYKK